MFNVQPVRASVRRSCTDVRTQRPVQQDWETSPNEKEYRELESNVSNFYFVSFVVHFFSGDILYLDEVSFTSTVNQILAQLGWHVQVTSDVHQLVYKVAGMASSSGTIGFEIMLLDQIS
mgnify:CR=1 FL=1